MRFLRRLARVGIVLVTWWVVANNQSVLGPFSTLSLCTDAAAAYAKAHHVEATCESDR
jgi:hypothetical protein